jgi:sec-independent protein translocase protein TatB
MTLAVLFDSIGFGEWFVLLAVVLVVVGPRRLPSAARTLGQYYSRLRRAAENFKRQLMDMDVEFDRAAREPGGSVDGAFAPDGPAASAAEPEPTAGGPSESGEGA